MTDGRKSNVVVHYGIFSLRWASERVERELASVLASRSSSRMSLLKNHRISTGWLARLTPIMPPIYDGWFLTYMLFGFSIIQSVRILVSYSSGVWILSWMSTILAVLPVKSALLPMEESPMYVNPRTPPIWVSGNILSHFSGTLSVISSLLLIW